MQELIQQILEEKNFKVSSTFFVSTFLQSPITRLYKELSPLYKSCYDVNERIVIVDDVCSTVIKQPFYNYLQKILKHLDITNCFVLVVGSNDTKQLLERSHADYSLHDTTYIDFLMLEVDQHMINSITNFNIPDSICVNPWINVELHTTGVVKPCCIYKYSDCNSIPSIKNLSINDTINSFAFIQLREKMRQGELVDECKKCWNDEKNGKKSKRQRDNYVFRDSLYKVDWNQTNTSNLKSLDIKLKNLCNLSCRICNPSLSSKWYDEVSKNPDVYQDVHLQIIKNDWRTDRFDQQVWDDFTSKVYDIEYVEFTGGEPLLDIPHEKLLEHFINTQTSKNISLHYNSNGTIYSDRLIPLWDKFKTIEISFSIDNVREKFEYERYGATWNKVVDTLVKYQHLDPTKYKFNIFSTVSVLNILDSYELYNFSKQMNLPIVFNILDTPPELSIAVLDHEQRKWINNFFTSITDDEFCKIIEPILLCMNNSPLDKNTNDLVKFLSRTDAVRNQDFTKIYPNLLNLINRRF